MPVHEATQNGRPGYQWGTTGHVYTYPPGDEAARKRAKERAFIQGYAATGPHGTRKAALAKAWSRPGLGDFTDRDWAQLSAAQRRAIGTHFAWAPANAKTFDDLKLPFKDPSGKVNLAGVRNALSRLPQTDGIPAAAKAKIRARLERILQKDLGLGDVHTPTAMGTSLAQYRRGQRLRMALGQLGPAPQASFPEEISIAYGFLKADLARVQKGAALPVSLDPRYDGTAFQLPVADLWLRLRKAAAAAGVTFALSPDGCAVPVALYDLVLKRSLPDDAGEDEDDEELEDEQGEDEDLDDEAAPGFRIVKADTPQQKVTGVVFEPRTVDTQDDYVERAEIEKAAHRFSEDYRTRRAHLGYNHQRALTDDEAVLCENYVTPEATKIGGQAVPAGTWCQVWKIKDPALWQEIQTGEITGFSFGGSGLRRGSNQPAAPLR